MSGTEKRLLIFVAVIVLVLFLWNLWREGHLGGEPARLSEAHEAVGRAEEACTYLNGRGAVYDQRLLEAEEAIGRLDVEDQEIVRAGFDNALIEGSCKGAPDR